MQLIGVPWLRCPLLLSLYSASNKSLQHLISAKNQKQNKTQVNKSVLDQKGKIQKQIMEKKMIEQSKENWDFAMEMLIKQERGSLRDVLEG